jgi:hypothetical protein
MNAYVNVYDTGGGGEEIDVNNTVTRTHARKRDTELLQHIIAHKEKSIVTATSTEVDMILTYYL